MGNLSIQSCAHKYKNNMSISNIRQVNRNVILLEMIQRTDEINILIRRISIFFGAMYLVMISTVIISLLPMSD